MGFVMHGDGQILMTHRVQSGVVPSSFGVSVAKMAGLPDAVLARARAQANAFIADAEGAKGLNVVRTLLSHLAKCDVRAIQKMHRQVVRNHNKEC